MVVNQIGNGLCTSPHDCDGDNAMSGFAQVRIGDDVRAPQQPAAELSGIERWALVGEAMATQAMAAQATTAQAVTAPG